MTTEVNMEEMSAEELESYLEGKSEEEMEEMLAELNELVDAAKKEYDAADERIAGPIREEWERLEAEARAMRDALWKLKDSGAIAETRQKWQKARGLSDAVARGLERKKHQAHTANRESKRQSFHKPLTSKEAVNEYADLFLSEGAMIVGRPQVSEETGCTVYHIRGKHHYLYGYDYDKYLGVSPDGAPLFLCDTGKYSNPKEAPKGIDFKMFGIIRYDLGDKVSYWCPNYGRRTQDAYVAMADVIYDYVKKGVPQ